MTLHSADADTVEEGRYRKARQRQCNRHGDAGNASFPSVLRPILMKWMRSMSILYAPIGTI